MDSFDKKMADLLSGRIVTGLREFSAEQRCVVFTAIQAVYCVGCGADYTVCKCMDEVKR